MLFVTARELDVEWLHERMKKAGYEQVGESKAMQQVDSHTLAHISRWFRYDKPTDPWVGREMYEPIQVFLSEVFDDEA
jgi:hypothetical protein